MSTGFLKKLAVAILLLTTFGLAEQLGNGQQIAFGGIRFDALEVSGINQNGDKAVWKSWGQFRQGGVTLAHAEGWWWVGSVQIRANYRGKQIFQCQTEPLKVGFMIVFVSPKNSKQCFGNASNSGLDASMLERFVTRVGQQRKLEALKKMLETAEDGWMCAKTLAGNLDDVSNKCRGVANNVTEQLR